MLCLRFLRCCIDEFVAAGLFTWFAVERGLVEVELDRDSGRDVLCCRVSAVKGVSADLAELDKFTICLTAVKLRFGTSLINPAQRWCCLSEELKAGPKEDGKNTTPQKQRT